VRLQYSVIAALIGCGSSGGFPDAAAQLGTFSFAWAVNDTSGTQIACDQVGATEVEAATTSHGAGPGPTEDFVCGLAQGQSEQLVPGLYDVGFTLVGNAGNLVMAPSQTGVTIVAGQNTQLQPVTFTIDASGNFSMTIATGLATNCGPTPGGAGIQSMTLAIEHSSNDSCAPMTVNVAGGAAYVLTDCANPPSHACIENNQALTGAMPVESGEYTFRLRGVIGGMNCWSVDANVTIPALGGVVTTTATLVHNTAIPGC